MFFAELLPLLVFCVRSTPPALTPSSPLAAPDPALWVAVPSMKPARFSLLAVTIVVFYVNTLCLILRLVLMRGSIFFV